MLCVLKTMNTPDRDLPLAEKIKECQEESHRTYGYRRVHIWLERQGIYRNPKTVLRVIFKDFIGCSSSGLSRAEPPQSVRESYTRLIIPMLIFPAGRSIIFETA